MARSALGRAVLYINLLIAALLVAALAVVWWFAWRPLPRRSGSVPAALDGRASIAWDRSGVPHIRAASLEDAWFAQGYATAQERLWQMDALRRLAAGDLAEVIGPAGLESDREARRLRLRRIAEEAATVAPPEDLAVLAAYARGVNAYMRGHMDRLPLEFSLLGYHPRPWSVVDSILVGLQMFRTLTDTWRSDLARRSMLASGDRAKVETLYPVRSGGEAQFGSNAWAIAGSRTATGRPILANDMHLDYSLPNVWFAVRLQAPGLNVAGVSLPGAPGVIAGHNDRIAWGITNLGFDVQDLYIERFDDRTGRYLYRGATEQARREREIIRVKNAPAQEMTNWVTRHGPLFVSEGGERLSLRWAGANPRAFAYPFPEINRARNWREFTAALARLPGPGSNFVYADTDGNIGFQVAGLLPIRRNFEGHVPVDGATGEYEWDGWIPFSELPSAFNPPAGFIVTANQNPFPPGYPYRVGGVFAAHYRERQIRKRLESRAGWRAEEMAAIQKDIYCAFSHFLARRIVAAWDRKPSRPALREAVELLRGWNGQMDQALAAPLVATLAYRHFRRELSQAAVPKGPAWTAPMAPAVIERLLREQPDGWFDDWDAQLLAALESGLEEGRRLQGSSIARWRYGRYLQLYIRHPVISRVPLVGRYFDIGPLPASGSGTTVKQTTARMGPSMRMSVEAGDWDRTVLTLPIGQSGHALSRHYRDQWKDFYAGENRPLPFLQFPAGPALLLEPRR